MTKKEKIRIIRLLLKQYEKDKNILNSLNQANYYPSINSEDYYQTSSSSKEDYLLNRIYLKQELTKRIIFIEKSQSIIGDEYYHIILEDYFYEHKHWWKTRYSRATYYRRQEAAIDASNVMLVVDGKTTRVGFKMDGDKKVRFAKATGKVID